MARPGYLALFAAPHLMARRVTPHGDPQLLPIAALLNGLGLVMIHRLDLAYAAHVTEANAAAPAEAAPRQLAWTALGILRRPGMSLSVVIGLRSGWQDLERGCAGGSRVGDHG